MLPFSIIFRFLRKSGVMANFCFQFMRSKIILIRQDSWHTCEVLSRLRWDNKYLLERLSWLGYLASEEPSHTVNVCISWARVLDTMEVGVPEHSSLDVFDCGCMSWAASSLCWCNISMTMKCNLNLWTKLNLPSRKLLQSEYSILATRKVTGI